MLEERKMVYDGREPQIGFVAEGDEEKLLGFSYAHKAIIIDPFICTIPMAALKLFLLTQGAVSALGFTNVVVQVSSDNEKLLDELPRMGFEKVQNKYVIFKKVI
jgi:hypothetical protein